MSFRIFAAAVATSLLSLSLHAQVVVTLEPSKDNTIYEDSSSLSNGAGSHIFAGMNGYALRRRALLHFDLSALPPGAVILSATLTLHVSQTTAPGVDVDLHRLPVDWGEGTSQAPGQEGGGGAAAPGDATWAHTYFPSTFWNTSGGDFDPASSATTSVGFGGFYTWSSPQLTQDVRDWQASPSSNFGWTVIGYEAPGLTSTAKRFDSRQHSVAGERPKLKIGYALIDGACCMSDGTCAVLSPGDCATAGGTFMGAGVRCVTSSEVVRLGSPPNSMGLLPGVTSKPALGQTWDPVVSPPTSALATVLAVSANATPINVPTPFGVLLCNLPPPGVLLVGTPGVPFAVGVPLDCTLAGARLCAQGAGIVSVGPLVLELYNALDVTIGHA